jgi:hypothetical protein
LNKQVIRQSKLAYKEQLGDPKENQQQDYLQPSRRHAFQQQKLTSQADPPADSSPISKQHQPAKEAKSKSRGGTTQQECFACPAKRQVSKPLISQSTKPAQGSTTLQAKQDKQAKGQQK